MWLIPPRERVRQFFSADACIVSVHFRCEWPSGQDVIASKEGVAFAAQRFPDLLHHARELERMVGKHFPAHEGAHKHHSQQVSDFDLFLRFQAVFLNWLSAWFQLRVKTGASLSRLQAGDDRTLKAVRCLNEAPLDQRYPREALQAATQLSEVHLTRVFLRAYDLTPRKYWERRQLEFARLCLETSSIPVKEVAYRTGFRSVSHFVVWFRRHLNCAPGEFRSNAARVSPR
jgi:AraC-like DNA-binding protein